MSLESDIRLLSRVRLFEGFSQEHLRLLAFGAEPRRLGAGTRIYRQGTYSDGGYVIVSGKVELVSGKDGALVSTHTTGSLIGEMALISEVDYAATAVAVEHSEVLKIPRPLFRRMLEEFPALAELLIERISQSSTAFIKQLEVIKAKLDHATDLAERSARKSS